MERTEALAILGVAPSAAPDEIRAAYRAALREHHPDRGVDDSPSRRRARTERTAALNTAYRVLRTDRGEARRPAGSTVAAPASASAPATAPTTGSATAANRAAAEVGEGTRLLLALSPEDAYFALVEASHAIGFVSYVDRQNGILEVIVTKGAPDEVNEVTSIMIEVTGVEEHSLVALYAEPLGRHEPASLDDFTAALVERLTSGTA
ncbi:MAG: DnaJ domain-containing protein [Acidimicrobiia bacterium]